MLGLLTCREEEEERAGKAVQTRRYTLAEGIDLASLAIPDLSVDTESRNRIEEAKGINGGASPPVPTDISGIEPTVGSVPFMLTQEVKRRLRIYGYSDEQIAHLTPQQAHQILAEQGWQPDA
jgi:hypothetical protein